MGLRRPIDLVFSAAMFEPGILGISKPVLVLPSGISERLSDAQSRQFLLTNCAMFAVVTISPP